MVGLKTLGPARADDVCELLITADLPGVDQKDVEVTVSGDILTIKAQTKAEYEEKGDDGNYRESRTESRSRSISLPFDVSEEEIDADFDAGVLTICVRKRPKAICAQKPPEAQKAIRRIEVKGKGTCEGEVRTAEQAKSTPS
jgi:HSP20 family protein